MSKHTPGPWEIVNATDVFTKLGATSAEGTETAHNDGWRIADCASIPTTNKDGEQCELSFREAHANARLIAAAPELLEACQTFAEWLRREEEGLPGGIVRGTPEGERQWRIWWDENLRICNLAQQQVRAAIAKATGGKP